MKTGDTFFPFMTNELTGWLYLLNDIMYYYGIYNYTNLHKNNFMIIWLYCNKIDGRKSIFIVIILVFVCVGVGVGVSVTVMPNIKDKYIFIFIFIYLFYLF